MPNIRNSTKAILVENQRLLLAECRVQTPQGLQPFYTCPGGGQNPFEPLDAALRREMLEETGCEVEVGALAFVREFIDPASPWGAIHQVEFFFHCRRLTPLCPARASEPDAEQVAIRWVPLADLPSLPLYPAFLATAFTPGGRLDCPAYVGKC